MISFAFPYTAILIKARLGVSIGVVGLILGGTTVAGLPLQLVGGTLSDRVGRRSVMIVCALGSALMYGGLAFAHQVWLVVVCVFCDRALGWPMYLTASNAMVADLTRERLRAEGFGMVRLVISAGTVVGPIVSAALLAAGFTIPFLFGLAGGGCLVFLALTLIFLKESRPAAVPPPTATEPRARAGHATVLRDGRFLAFCAASLLPLFIFGQLYSTYPVLITGVLGVKAGTWGLLVAFNALVIVVFQYPVVKWLKRFDGLVQIALACLLFGIGVGAVAFIAPGWPLLTMIFVVALAQAIFSPVSSAIVGEMAPAHLRGRYMGVWTLVWTGGLSALGPIGGGLLMDALGPHGSYAALILLGVAGMVLFAALRGRERLRVGFAP